jgi:hypothetical protein
VERPEKRFHGGGLIPHRGDRRPRQRSARSGGTRACASASSSASSAR